MPRPDGSAELTCALSKGWRGRTPRTHTSVEHPGSAVEWEEQIFEVVEATPLADGRMRYRLAPWDSRHAIRTLDRYDEPAEIGREAERAERRKDRRSRRGAILLAPLLGHLPGHVQEEMEKEFGAPAVGMTIVSAFPFFVLGFLASFNMLASGIGARLIESGQASVLPWLDWMPPVVGIFLVAESAFRLAGAVAASRPCGSLLGVLAYEAWVALGGRRLGRPLTTRVETPFDPERAAADRFHLLEPLAALLRPDEQAWLAARYPFDPIRWGRRTAAWLSAFAVLNIAISLLRLAAGTGGLGDFLWFLLGVALLLEQMGRRRALRRGQPAGSLLGAFVRPLAREMLRERR